MACEINQSQINKVDRYNRGLLKTTGMSSFSYSICVMRHAILLGEAITLLSVRRFPVTAMPIPLNEPSSTKHAVMTWPILKNPESPRDEASFSRTMESTFLSESLLNFSLSVFVDPSSIPSFVPLFVPIVAAGVARIHPRRDESHPLSLLSQARTREYVVGPFSSGRFDVHPGQDIPGPRTFYHVQRKCAVYPHVPPINQNPLRLNYRGTRP